MSTSFNHPYRIDSPTLARARSAAGYTNLISSALLPPNFRFITINPAAFAHAYLLLGENPQRFVTDLTFYLSTIKAFFERTDAVGGIFVPSTTNPDARRRLSEDLGVGLASFFMVEVLGLGWETISQIPQNSKLSKKRPDFQGYTSTNQRFLYEAKGTTKLQSIEKTMSKALGQVKNYPEIANAKIAIVSYLSADERFFPSASFVVDPPALPEEVPPTERTSRLLHFEKVLQFAGYTQTAKDYVSTLSYRLKEEHRLNEGAPPSEARTRRLEALQEELRNQFTAESESTNLEFYNYRESQFIGRYIHDKKTKTKIFFGVEKDVLNAGIEFEIAAKHFETKLVDNESDIISLFSDGTLLHVSGIKGVRK